MLAKSVKITTHTESALCNNCSDPVKVIEGKFTLSQNAQKWSDDLKAE